MALLLEERPAARDPQPTADPVAELSRAVHAAVRDPQLTYHQRVQRLAALAEGVLPPPTVSAEVREALEAGVICSMFEGNAPYRPRYILPDYALALRNGSAFLELPPPRDLHEALWFLISLYRNVPSITGYPVYLGDLDALLEPYLAGMSASEIVPILRPFWRALDRVLPDAFVHTNLGPQSTPFAHAVFALERELQQVVPNITLKVDPEITPDELLLDAVQTVFLCAKPHFVNHRMMTSDLGDAYAAVSCYNSLKIGGGAHTLVRLNLLESVRRHPGDAESYLSTALPRDVRLTAELIAARSRFLVEEARFFEHDWLAREGLVRLERFSAMFGIYGLAEAVQELMRRAGKSGRYGHDATANALAARLVERVAERVAAEPLPHCEGFGGRALLHSQSGIDSDVGVSAGTRIPIGDEPPLHAHLAAVAPHHRHFASGVSDILHFDETARGNPEGVVDIIRGALAQGMRDVTFNLDSNDFIRITGYLVRKSDLARIDQGARHGSTFLGAGSENEAHCSQRSSKRVIAAERQAGS